jgi:hypothetical protein
VQEGSFGKKIPTLIHPPSKCGRCVQQFSLLTPDREIPSSVRLQLINSHSLDCTSVPWESLTLMVISLALVNGIH